MRGKKAKALRRIIRGAEETVLRLLPSGAPPSKQMKAARKRMFRHLKQLTK